MFDIKPIILASASPRRREILNWAGVPFTVCPATEEYAPQNLPPDERVKMLARSKAMQVASAQSDKVILGADTMVVLDGKMLGKPVSEENAVDMLMSLQGREHQVMTGVWLIQTDGDYKVVKEDGFTDITAVKFHAMTRDEAAWYVSTGEPMDKAGAYGIQGIGMRFVEGIRGDFFTVMGLPGSRLLRFLQEFSGL